MFVSNRYLVQQNESVIKLFNYWRKYMYQHIKFNLRDSQLHSYEHSERVLLFALILGSDIVSESENELLPLIHASVFHDTCRLDEGLDTGHGLRAADSYKKFCETSDLTFIPAAYKLMKYHDQDDKTGESEIHLLSGKDAGKDILYYRIFKDSDALDRFRLGENAFDQRFLRLNQSHSLIEFARDIILSSF